MSVPNSQQERQVVLRLEQVIKKDLKEPFDEELIRAKVTTFVEHNWPLFEHDLNHTPKSQEIISFQPSLDLANSGIDPYLLPPSARPAYITQLTAQEKKSKQVRFQDEDAVQGGVRQAEGNEKALSAPSQFYRPSRSILKKSSQPLTMEEGGSAQAEDDGMEKLGSLRTDSRTKAAFSQISSAVSDDKQTSSCKDFQAGQIPHCSTQWLKSLFASRDATTDVGTVNTGYKVFIGLLLLLIALPLLLLAWRLFRKP